jgi:ribonucleoside-diphosphate reductase alpha chain
MSDIKSVIKRNKERVPFDQDKIVSAVSKAFGNVYPMKSNEEMVAAAKEAVIDIVAEINKVGNEEMSVEEIQNVVETALMKKNPEVAKAYILYRDKRSQIRKFKASLGIAEDNLKIPLNSLMVLAARYLLKDANGKIVESPEQLFHRVSTAIASQEKKYGRSEEEIAKLSAEFYDAMTNFRFMPNSPTLMNAGTPMGQLSACFVLPVGDSIPEIYDAIKYQAIIHQSGGGTGFAFSRLRPSGDIVKSTGGVSSGPLAFMKVFNASTEQIKQGGKRRGANMGILRIDHPDILDFIVSKENESEMRNFNISVAVTDVFMNALKNNTTYDLLNPRSGKTVGKLNARAVWNLIVTMAWRTGDPGLIFIDRMNSSYANPVPSLGPIEATNPCVTGDTLISTDEGMYRAEELSNGGIPLKILVDSRFGEGTTQFASPMVKTGVKPVVKLSTKEGFSIKLTKDHKVFSDSRGWIEAEKLEKGEKLRIANSSGSFGKEGTAEQGRVLGWLIGDGYVGETEKAGLLFYGNDLPLADQFAKDVNAVVRHTASKNGINQIGVVSLQGIKKKSIAAIRLKEFAVAYGLKEEKLRVPEKVFRGSEGMQQGFLQALFEADGTVSVQKKSRHTIRLTSISDELLRGVQLLLLNFGVFSKVYLNRKKAGTKELPGPDRKPKTYNVQALHEISIDGASFIAFAARIGFLSDAKEAKLKEAINSYTRGPYREDSIATVSSLEDLGETQVYDLQEPVTHSFLANGLVVHNCGEVPLYSFDSCNLASINLAKMVSRTDHHYEVDWDLLKYTTRMGVRFLDDVVDANKYPLKQIDDVTRAIRRIGLGVMGWADMLIKLGIRYDSNEALALAEKVMSFISENGRRMSEELAVERGPFPEFNNSIWARLGNKPLRNSTITTVAPTGTISIISGGASQGIEPIFSVVYMRNVHESLGYNLIEVNNEFEAYALEQGFYSDDLMQSLAGKLSIQDVEDVPEKVRRLFVTAYDISSEWHVKTQAAFQKYTDNGVSKTINFPNWATPQDIEKAYAMAYQLGCKGITVYRDASKSVQILQAVDTHQARLSEAKKKHEDAAKKATETITVAGVRESAVSYSLAAPPSLPCPDCGTGMVVASGCSTCPKCGYSKCA